MSYSTSKYSDYATFFSPIFPDRDRWDRIPRAHTLEEIVLLTEAGTCTVLCNGTTYQIPTPAFIWNRAGSYHMISGATVEKINSYLATFSAKFLKDVPPSLQCYDFIQGQAMFAMPLNAQRLRHLERLFLSMIGSPTEQRSALLGCAFHQISLYLKSGAETICASGDYSYIFKVIAALEQLNNGDLTIPALAERFHVGKTKLERDFKNCTGHTIHAFRLRVQLQAARQQILTTEKPLAQIANDCGFTDHSHLIRSFRKEYGITPGQYRRNYKKRHH